MHARAILVVSSLHFLTNRQNVFFFFNSKQRQGTNVAVFLRPGRPTKKEKRVLKVGRVFAG